jgi:H+/gluconate symporter-like permease
MVILFTIIGIIVAGLIVFSIMSLFKDGGGKKQNEDGKRYKDLQANEISHKKIKPNSKPMVHIAIAVVLMFISSSLGALFSIFFLFDEYTFLPTFEIIGYPIAFSFLSKASGRARKQNQGGVKIFAEILLVVSILFFFGLLLNLKNILLK